MILFLSQCASLGCRKSNPKITFIAGVSHAGVSGITRGSQFPWCIACEQAPGEGEKNSARGSERGGMGEAVRHSLLIPPFTIP